MQPDAISYSSLIAGCAKGGKTEEALDVFKFMQADEVEPDVMSYNSLITACANGGRTGEGWICFAPSVATPLVKNTP